MIWLAWRQQRFQFTAAAGLLAIYATLAVGAQFDPEFSTITQLFASYLTIAVCMFWGAPLIARDIEHGTHRLAWTQSITRGRWLATKLAVAAGGAVTATAVLTALVAWLPPNQTSDPMTWYHYESHGVVPFARVLFALALGTALGAISRQTQIAMAVSVPLIGLIQLGGARRIREATGLTYWPMQWSEAGIYLAAAVLLTGLTYLAIRRRT